MHAIHFTAQLMSASTANKKYQTAIQRAGSWRTQSSQAMAPPSGLHHSAIAGDFDGVLPPLVRSSTVPVNLETRHSRSKYSDRADPSHLAPEDAFTATSPPRRASAIFGHVGNGSGGEMRRARRIRHKDGESRSRSRRRKRFQKLLWVKQSCMSGHELRVKCEERY